MLNAQDQLDGRVQNRSIILLLVFFGGFANLAAEIIGPRLFASLFGNTSIIWAVMISVTLVGLSLGYSIGGRISYSKIFTVLPPLLIVNAFWLLAVSWIIWEVPASAVATGVRIDVSILIVTASTAFFVPSILFGMLTPLAITILSHGQPADSVSETVGNVYALSTIGSVLGALAAAFFLIPDIGLSSSLRLFAIGLLLFAAYYISFPRKAFISVAIVICIVFPQPDYVWRDDDGLTLLAQRDGQYQTIRVYQNESENYVQMHLGPTFHSRMEINTQEPLFSYAERMVEFAADVDGKQVLIIGGAGHAMAHWMENRGAIVTEVEIDPLVVSLSDRYFGSIDGEVIIQDGRVYLEQVEPESFDLVLVDAFDGAATVPPQLTTRQFFSAVQNALKENGQMIYNFVGTPQGERANAYRAIASTMHSVFGYVVAASSTGEEVIGETWQNIIFIASSQPIDQPDLITPPSDGTILTDELNPIDLYLMQAKDWYYFRR